MDAEFLVTGGAGFIGSNLVKILVQQGRRVRIYDNFSTGLPENLASVYRHIDIHEGDVRDPLFLAPALQGVRYVLHFAAIPSVVRSVEDPMATNNANITGTLNLLQLAREAGVERVVFSSSSSVYGNSEVLPKHEGMKPEPLSPYALSKLAGEHYCRMFYELYGLKTFALRYFNVFGPQQNPKSDYAAVIPLFIDALRHDRAPTVHGDGGQTRDFTYVEDVAAANIAACTAPEEAAGGVYNVARGDRISIRDLALKIGAALGKNIEPVHGPERPGDVRDSQADATAARTQLKWAPTVDLDEGLRRTVEWFNQHAK